MAPQSVIPRQGGGQRTLLGAPATVTITGRRKQAWQPLSAAPLFAL